MDFDNWQIEEMLVGFDEETWHALNLLSRESMKSFQELADEAIRDLLHKYGRTVRFESSVAGKRAATAVTGSSRKRRPKEHR